MPDTKTLRRNTVLYQAHLEEIRTGVLPRLWRAVVYRWTGYRYAAAAELEMAWERMTGTGDYTPGGHFDRTYPGWRNFDGDDIGHGRIRSPKAAHIDHAGIPDDRRYERSERTTDDDNGTGDGKPRVMEIPLFLAEAEPLVDRPAE